MKPPFILPTDTAALAPNVVWAGGRQAAEKLNGGTFPDFNPDEAQIAGEPTMRNWWIKGYTVRPNSTYDYEALDAQGVFKQFTIPAGVDLSKPNFAGQDASFRDYQSWLAAQPTPDVADKLGNGLSNTVQALILSDSNDAWVRNVFAQGGIYADAQEARSAAIDLVALPDDPNFQYGAKEKRRIRFVQVNGMVDQNNQPVPIAVGVLFRLLCNPKGLGYPGRLVAPAPGQMPVFIPDTRVTDAITQEWPVPNVIPEGYLPGMVAEGFITTPGYALAPAPAGTVAQASEGDILAAIQALDRKVTTLGRAQGVILT